MEIGMSEKEKLQSLCREYLSKLRATAEKYGLCPFVDTIISDNENGRCEGTEEEVEMLSRAIDDERVSRQEVPKILGKSYRQCVEAEDFENLKKLKRVGIYSKISALLYANSNNESNKRK